MTDNEDADQNLFYCRQSVEEMMARPDSFPRYAYLARKAISYYAGDLYNPQLDYFFELFTRLDIKIIVEYKVLHRLKEYDWEYIDTLFKARVSSYFKIELEHDLTRLEKGFAPLYGNPFEDDDKTKAH